MFEVNVERTGSGRKMKNYLGTTDGNFVDPVISSYAKNSYVSEGPAYNSLYNAFNEYSQRNEEEQTPVSFWGIIAELVKRLLGSGPKETAEGNPEFEEFLKNIKYEIADTSTLNAIYEKVNGKPPPGNLGGLWVPYKADGKVFGGEIYISREVPPEEWDKYENHELGHAITDYDLSRRGIDPDSIPEEYHERIAEQWEVNLN